MRRKVVVQYLYDFCLLKCFRLRRIGCKWCIYISYKMQLSFIVLKMGPCDYTQQRRSYQYLHSYWE